MEGELKIKSKRKFLGRCEKCQRNLCEEHAYFFVDGNNRAITNNSPYLCKECYEETYGEKIKSDVERFKDEIIRNFKKIKEEHKIENIRIDALIKYIEKA